MRHVDGCEAPNSRGLVSLTAASTCSHGTSVPDSPSSASTLPFASAREKLIARVSMPEERVQYVPKRKKKHAVTHKETDRHKVSIYIDQAQ